MFPSIRFYLLWLAVMSITACNQAQKLSQHSAQSSETTTVEPSSIDFPSTLEKISKSAEEWKTQLDSQAYHVLREAGTERAFTGAYWDNKEAGVYVCGACELPLFSSDTKFKSGTGWPSFYEPIRDNYVAEESDRSYGMVRTEVLCARCDGHLGHVFNDGPRPTGLRYCINSVSLNFVPAKPMEGKN